MKNEYKNFYKRAEESANSGKPFVLFAFFSMNGVSENEQQIMLLNEEEPKKAMVPIQSKLKLLTKTGAKVIAFYDTCRDSIDNYPRLTDVRGRGGGSGIGTDRAGSIKQDVCGYIHLCTCGPGGVASV